jgi:hypothetical protein
MGAHKVNELVQEFPAMELTGFSKMERHNGSLRIDPMG